ncbi:hypothetical protein [Klebsiella pneumoniae]|uniref:hypothetical protein n=1 Tax=Klebsiella pneumoniae TaxID=573 RepID=UPI002DBEF647|nr:hypothetical protein [Klebsiella pneumoniae]MEB7571355.1 hypothetical protein [Klebsiella pneumoniae]
MADITELAQMKGQKVEGSYYLAECTDCGKMYPSNKLNGGEPLFSGDYGECYCPHCNADDAAIGDCGDTAAMAWNYQQDRIDALVEALEKAQRANEYLREQSAEWERKAISNFEDCAEMSARVEELESQRKLAFTASNRWADKFREAEKRIAELESRTVNVKLPQRYDLIGETDGNCSLNDAEMAPDNDGVYLRVRDVREMLTAAGIKWEAE